MTQPLLSRLRRLWRDIHLWIGVGLLALLVPLGLSGALLVWHDGLDQALHPKRFAISDGASLRPASAYLAASRTALGDRASVSQIRMPEEGKGPVTVSARITGQVLRPGERPQSLTVWLDPATARVLDVANTRNELVNIMHRLHGSLLITTPGLGRKIVGWMGWAMTLSCLTGLWLWWPRNGKVLTGLRWRRTPWTLDNLHHLFGFWVLVPLLAVSLTGVYISFPDTSRALFGVGEPVSGPRPPRPAPAAPLDSPSTDIDRAVAVASATQPDLALVAISLPTEGRKPAWRLQFASDERDSPITVQVGDSDGQVQKPRAGSGGPASSDRLSPVMRKIHDAKETPLIWQVLVFLTGVAPPVLGISGVWMWLQRRARRRRTASS
jgi:uncharacterized iron-regulated membrane protein